MGDLKPIFSYLKPYRRELAAAIILLLAECIFEMVIPLLMTDIVDVGVPNHDIGFLYRQGGADGSVRRAGLGLWLSVRPVCRPGGLWLRRPAAPGRVPKNAGLRLF